MTIHTCLRCDYENIRLDAVKRHIYRKKRCNPVIVDSSVDDCVKALTDTLFAHIYIKKEVRRLKEIVIPNITFNGNENIAGDNNLIVKGDNNTIINLTLLYENTNYDVIKNQLSKCIINGKIDKEKLLHLTHFNKEYYFQDLESSR